MAAPDRSSHERLALYTSVPRREGETICGLSQLTFTTLSKLEVFLSTSGNQCFGDRVVKVSNMLVYEEPQDVYCVLVGVGRYLHHYLGVRKGGANTRIGVYPVAETHSTLAGWSGPPPPCTPPSGRHVGRVGVGVVVGRTGGWRRALETIFWEL